jgi:hypothetical protein
MFLLEWLRDWLARRQLRKFAKSFREQYAAKNWSP